MNKTNKTLLCAFLVLIGMGVSTQVEAVNPFKIFSKDPKKGVLCHVCNRFHERWKVNLCKAKRNRCFYHNPACNDLGHSYNSCKCDACKEAAEKRKEAAEKKKEDAKTKKEDAKTKKETQKEIADIDAKVAKIHKKIVQLRSKITSLRNDIRKTKSIWLSKGFDKERRQRQKDRLNQRRTWIRDKIFELDSAIEDLKIRKLEKEF